MTGTKSLDDDDLQGVFVRDAAGTVIFQAPAGAGQQHEHRTQRKGKTAAVLHREQDAGNRHKDNGRPQPPGNALPEQPQGDEGRSHDLEVIEQRNIGRRGARQTDHKKDRRRDVQYHHTHSVGQVGPGQGRFPGDPAHSTLPCPHQRHTAARPQVEQRRHHGGRYFGQQPFGQRRVQRIERSRQNGGKNIGSGRCHSESGSFPAGSFRALLLL